MKKLLFTTLSTLLLLVVVSKSTIAQSKSKRINIYYDRNMVCVQRSNKCYAFAKGKSSYPTPTWEGPQYLTTHITKGFKWKNPITGQVFNKGEHNLGDIWIQFYEDEDPNSPTYGWVFGFHLTPESNKPLSEQFSHGCGRMMYGDLINFSNELEYLDEFYIIRDSQQKK